LSEISFWAYKGPSLLWPYKHLMHQPISLTGAL
jgi:hypothetical protein